MDGGGSPHEDFKGAGACPGVEIWCEHCHVFFEWWYESRVAACRRIENFAPVRYAETSGKFHTGDSYIVLKVLLHPMSQ